MVMPAVKAQILSDLNQLSPTQQRRAAELVRGLVSALLKGASVEDLLRVAGALNDEADQASPGAPNVAPISAQLCGPSHYRMRGYLSGDTPETYAKWIADNSPKTALPATPATPAALPAGTAPAAPAAVAPPSPAATKVVSPSNP